MIRTVTTTRLVLRPLSEEDVDAWRAFWGDPEAVRLTHRPEPIVDPDASLEALKLWAGMYDDPIGMYSVHVLESSATAGFVGFVPRELPWGREVELGWLLRPSFWSSGYATEAARALRPLVPGRVISLVRVENDASAKVAQKLGMVVEREIDYRGFRTNVWVSPAAP